MVSFLNIFILSLFLLNCGGGGSSGGSSSTTFLDSGTSKTYTASTATTWAGRTEFDKIKAIPHKMMLELNHSDINSPTSTEFQESQKQHLGVMSQTSQHLKMAQKYTQRWNSRQHSLNRVTDMQLN